MSTPSNPSENIRAIQETTADHIGDLYEIISGQQRNITDIAERIGLDLDNAPDDQIQTSFFGAGDDEAIGRKQSIAVERHNNVRGFYRLVRDFVIRAKPWTQAIRYHTKPDERLDLTLVSRRVYGYPEEFITVMAAAGLDSVENTLQEQLLTLPPPGTLSQLKAIAGYQNLDMDRPL